MILFFKGYGHIHQTLPRHFFCLLDLIRLWKGIKRFCAWSGTLNKSLLKMFMLQFLLCAPRFNTQSHLHNSVEADSSCNGSEKKSLFLGQAWWNCFSYTTSILLLVLKHSHALYENADCIYYIHLSGLWFNQLKVR